MSDNSGCHEFNVDVTAAGSGDEFHAKQDLWWAKLFARMPPYLLH
jgi:hypothetical protein